MPAAVVPMTSKRRATPGKWGSMASTVAGAMPSLTATRAAAVAFSRLCAPGWGSSSLISLLPRRRTPLARAGRRERGAGHAGLSGDPRHHAGHGALAAGAGHGDPGPARVDDLRQQRRPGHQLDPELARRAHLGRVRLDGRREDEAVDRRRHGRAILGLHGNAELAEAGRNLLVLALVEGTVRALDLVTAGAHELGERIHPGAGDAREVVALPHQ